METRKRTFNGEIYKLYVIESSKRETNKEKKRLMDFGHKVRVTKSRMGYVLWTRK